MNNIIASEGPFTALRTDLDETYMDKIIQPVKRHSREIPSNRKNTGNSVMKLPNDLIRSSRVTS
jgi:hypothetical protein